MNDLTRLNTAEGSESLNLTGHCVSLMARLASQVETKASWLGMAWLAVSRVGFRCLKEWAKFGLKRGKRWRKDEKGWTWVYMDRKPSTNSHVWRRSRTPSKGAVNAFTDATTDPANKADCEMGRIPWKRNLNNIQNRSGTYDKRQTQLTWN